MHKGGLSADYFELSQFFPNESEPQNPQELAAKGEAVLNAFHRMNLWPTELVSAASVYDRWVLSHADLPTMGDFPEEVLPAFDMAWETAGRLWICAFKIGHWDKAYSYDLRSSFPWAASQMIDVRHCDIVHKSEPDPKACYAYFKGMCEIDRNVKVSPILDRVERGNESELIAKTGRFPYTISLSDWAFIRKWGIGSFKAEDGWNFIPRKVNHPLAMLVKKMLAYKSEDGLVSSLSKQISVSDFYGKFIEYHEDTDTPGKHFMSVWGSEIANKIRLRVGDFIYRNKIDPISTQVDNVLTTDEKDPHDTHEPGSWKLDHAGKALVVGSGLVYFKGKHPLGLDYNKAMSLIAANHKASYYDSVEQRVTTLGDALQWNDFQALGSLHDYHVSLDVTKQRTHRLFRKLPRTGGELINGVFDSEMLKA